MWERRSSGRWPVSTMDTNDGERPGETGELSLRLAAPAAQGAEPGADGGLIHG